MDASDLLALAEEPGLWLPPEPKLAVAQEPGFTFVRYGRDAWVHRIRLLDDAVEGAVARAAEAAAASEVTSLTWWLGELTTPANLPDRRLALGFEPEEEMTSLTLARPPAGEPRVAVRRVDTYDDLLVALELDWSV